jgi:uncharacterized protein with NAD-binding domain and iron-sulfur cluster
MGDTVFAPFYEVLKRRGVHFKFFHCVTKVGLSSANEATKYVTSVEVIPQVPLTVAEYDPLILVKELPCWPSEPLWNQLERGDALRQQGINFEYECNPLAVAPITLHKDQDFDIVILGISLAALPAICSDIIAQNPKWEQMVTQIKTVMTQAFQLWTNQDVAKLGWAYTPGSLCGPYVEPLDTYADMSHLIAHENWPDNYDLQAIAYFCGVLPDAPHCNTQADATAQAYCNAIEFLNRDIKGLWPKACQSAKPEVINWDVLIDPAERQGEERFRAQYWRANFQPSERYVLSVAGSNGCRLRADESGYHNLFLVGDWTNSGLNAGHIEAATMSGMQAARAICGYPIEIIGEKDPWLQV